jgi:hypothetical protein
MTFFDEYMCAFHPSIKVHWVNTFHTSMQFSINWIKRRQPPLQYSLLPAGYRKIIKINDKLLYFTFLSSSGEWMRHGLNFFSYFRIYYGVCCDVSIFYCVSEILFSMWLLMLEGISVILDQPVVRTRKWKEIYYWKKSSIRNCWSETLFKMFEFCRFSVKIYWFYLKFQNYWRRFEID